MIPFKTFQCVLFLIMKLSWRNDWISENTLRMDFIDNEMCPWEQRMSSLSKYALEEWKIWCFLRLFWVHRDDQRISSMIMIRYDLPRYHSHLEMIICVEETHFISRHFQKNSSRIWSYTIQFLKSSKAILFYSKCFFLKYLWSTKELCMFLFKWSWRFSGLGRQNVWSIAMIHLDLSTRIVLKHSSSKRRFHPWNCQG